LLIKAIEERVFQPLGSTDWRKSQFRLITATNVSLADLKKRLDPDFFDRIAMIILKTPSLREAKDDISWLWREVFNQVVCESGTDYELPEECHECIQVFLSSHSLPGNIRDLYAISWRILANWPEPQYIKVSELFSWIKTAIDVSCYDIGEDISRTVAGRFAENGTLDQLVSPGSPLETKKIQRDYLAWIGEEIRRIALNRNTPPESLVDVTAKTLREWTKFK
jgi:DNA-binding NtrC family response regulator